MENSCFVLAYHGYKNEVLIINKIRQVTKLVISMKVTSNKGGMLDHIDCLTSGP